MELVSPKHEQFCRALVAGNSPEVAYKAIFKVKDKNTAEILARQPRIRRRILDLKEEKDKKLAKAKQRKA